MQDQHLLWRILRAIGCTLRCSVSKAVTTEDSDHPFSFSHSVALTDKTYDDLSMGYVVLTQPPLCLSWDTTYRTLQHQGLCHVKQDRYGQFFRVKAKIRMGCLLVNKMQLHVSRYQTDSHITLDDPVSHYSISFHASQEKLVRAAIKRSIQGYDATQVMVKENLSLEVWLNGLMIHVYSNGLTIYNDRDFTGKRALTEQESNLQASRLLLLGEVQEIQTSYHKSAWIKSTPPHIMRNYPQQCLAWVDEQQQMFGIKGWQNSIIMPLAYLKCIDVEFMRPAKGAGYAYIVVHGGDETITLWRTASNREYDASAEQLAQFLNVPLTYTDGGYDC